MDSYLFLDASLVPRYALTMPRVARIVIPDMPHHVTQRGNNRQDVFFVDDDRRTYLALLKDRSAKYGLEVLGYCLMTNHVHIVGIPSTEESLAKAIGRTNLAYTQAVNRLHGRSGHLWQNRFYSCVLDEPHMWRALSYIERNPVRAGIARVAWRYPWSSAAAHVGGRDASGLLDLDVWSQTWNAEKWAAELRCPEEEGQAARLWNATNTGRPLATDSTLSKLEHKLGRRLRALPIGRPRAENAARPRSARSRKK
jgi:putative transposase